MVRLEATLEPHVGARLVTRLEHSAKDSDAVTREQRLADALETLTTDTPGSSGKTELVVLVSHEVAQRGWTSVRAGEQCKVPGVGPISAQAARDLATDAFITAIVTDGQDLRELKRWTRHIPVGVRIALSLGDPPGFDGLSCVDCGARLGLEYDHQVPFAAGGPTSLENLGLRCQRCHHAKTRRDHQNVNLKPNRAPTTPKPKTRTGPLQNAPP
jgi:5-methylcytosine-specific restriction endonuclease McrA